MISYTILQPTHSPKKMPKQADMLAFLPFHPRLASHAKVLAATLMEQLLWLSLHLAIHFTS